MRGINAPIFDYNALQSKKLLFSGKSACTAIAA